MLFDFEALDNGRGPQPLTIRRTKNRNDVSYLLFDSSSFEDVNASCKISRINNTKDVVCLLFDSRIFRELHTKRKTQNEIDIPCLFFVSIPSQLICETPTTSKTLPITHEVLTELATHNNFARKKRPLKKHILLP